MDCMVFHRCALLGFLLAAVAHGLEITTGGSTAIEKASGESVKLDCHFSLAPEDSGPLDIEWSLLVSDQQKEIILYSGDRAYEDYLPSMKGRVHFNSADPKNGDASINLTGLKSSDTGTYQCKVKKAPGIANRKMQLTVMVRPSKPQCYVEGQSEEGKDVVLKCRSAEGTNPVKYTWEKTTDNQLLPASAVLDLMGTMNVKNASASASGTCRCTAKNRVGTEECILTLRVMPPSNKAGIIAGAVIGVLLALILIAIILFCCCRARNKKKYEKETSYEIRTFPPPKSRVSTARSFTSVGSQRSSLGSMSPSNLHEYALKPQYDKIPSDEYERPQPRPLPPPGKMAGPNLSRMGAIPVMIPAQNRDGSIV